MLLYLPAGGGDAVHDVVEDERLDGAILPIRRGEAQRFLLSALDAGDKGVGPAAGTVMAGRQLEAVAHLVADQRQGAGEQDGDEYLGAVLAGWHRPVVGVDDFGDDEVLEEVHSGVLAAFGGDPGGFGGTVDIECWSTPGCASEPAGGIGQDLRGAEHELRADG